MVAARDGMAGIGIGVKDGMTVPSFGIRFLVARLGVYAAEQGWWHRLHGSGGVGA